MTCNKRGIISTIIHALTADYQNAIISEKLQAESSDTGMTFKILISAARDTYETRALRKDMCMKKGTEVGLATTNSEKKCFKCGKSGPERKDWPDKNNNQNGTETTRTCHLYRRMCNKMTKCWWNSENPSKCPENCKPNPLWMKQRRKLKRTARWNGANKAIHNQFTKNRGSRIACWSWKEFLCSEIEFSKD